MTMTEQLEADLLRLPARDRERLALAAWESLAEDDAWCSDPRTDSEGLSVAHQRDHEIESGQIAALSQEEFAERTRSLPK